MQRQPEPDPEAAWRFVRAFFEESYNAAFGIVHRTWFEARLKEHFNHLKPETDPSWYALRNIIYAYGCSIESCKNNSYSAAQRLSGQWFENALSVHSDLLFRQTSVVSVHALTLMVFNRLMILATRSIELTDDRHTTLIV